LTTPRQQNSSITRIHRWHDIDGTLKAHQQIESWMFLNIERTQITWKQITIESWTNRE
jgi:hypothetical protein